jgi:predicted NBD/HSP70 family sugar kinase
LPVDLRELLRAPNGAREEHRLLLLRTIMARSGNQAYLSRRSGLSQATVSEAVRELQDKDLVRATKGGKDNVVEIVPTTGAAVGIELGFQFAAIVARRVEQRYDEARTRICRVGAVKGAASWPAEVAEGVRDVISELGQDIEDVATIGLGVPRMVDPQGGKLTPPLLPPWDTNDPAGLLADKLRRGSWSPKVLLDNDANLAALAESTYAFDRAETLISIKASTGVGAGIVVGGKLFRGGRGVAGEIGHVVVEPGGRFCSCGGRGCLETLIGADALVEQARTVLGGRRQDAPETLELLVQKAGGGNLVCQRVLQEAASRLGFAIGNLCNILNPSVVVLGGALGRPDAAKYTIGPCREALRHSAMKAACEQGLEVRVSTLQHAAAHGALVMGLDGTTY